MKRTLFFRQFDSPRTITKMRMAQARCLALISCCALLTAQVGCATYTAVKIPGPVHDENIAIGMHRSDVEALLAVSAVSEYDDPGGRKVRYEYSDGPHQASKGRVLIYIAGDVFTFFLSELIFWPIEAYATNRVKRVGTAYYDDDDMVLMWTVNRLNGEQLSSIGEHPSASIATAESIPVGELSEEVEPVAYAVNCLSCHGETGKGDGPGGMDLQPPPRDFSTGDFKFDGDGDGKVGTDADLKAVVAKGAGAFGGNQMMAAWDGVLSEEEIGNVVGYIRTLKQ